MTNRILRIWAVWLALLAGCKHGTGANDFERKQFTATYTAAARQETDTTSLTHLLDSKAIYTFREDGKGINHVQIGMKSKDRLFTWKMEGDSLRIDNKPYGVRKHPQGFVLTSDSVSITLRQQP